MNVMPTNHLPLIIRLLILQPTALKQQISVVIIIRNALTLKHNRKLLPISLISRIAVSVSSAGEWLHDRSP